MQEKQVEKAKVGQHMGLTDLLDIFKIITAKPMTAKEIASLHKCRLQILRRTLRSMVQLNIARIVGWDLSIRGTPSAIFAAGCGDSVAPPIGRNGKVSTISWAKNIKIKPTANMVLFASMIRALEIGATVAELTEQSGCNPTTANRFLNHARRIRVAYIESWLKNPSGYPARVFMLGEKRDAPRPKAMTPKEKSLRQYYARKERKHQQAMNAAFFAVVASS
jgi:hypothetical protein